MQRGRYETRKKRAPLWYYALLFLLICTFAGSVWYLADYYLDSRQQAEAYDNLAAQVDAVRGVVPTEQSNQAGKSVSDDVSSEMLPPGRVENIRDEDGILLEYAPICKQNPDLAGWIAIAGTKINYPVMQTPDRTDYYLQRAFSGEYSAWGCIYAREECDLDAPSDNITLYGHNMKDGSMFAGLNAYTSREFWQSHRYIRFDTLKEHHTYEIFAVFTTTATVGEGFAYHNFIDAGDETEFNAFIAECLSLSLYSTDIVPVYGDKIICLSTCEYSRTNGRLVVVAVRID